MRDSLRHAEKQLNIYKIRQEGLQTLSDSNSTMKAIARVVNAGFWKFLGTSGKHLRFITANDVILFEKNPRGKLNIQKNMGTYLLKINLGNLADIKVLAFKGNTKVNRSNI